jgi:hypothetical protein
VELPCGKKNKKIINVDMPRCAPEGKAENLEIVRGSKKKYLQGDNVKLANFTGSKNLLTLNYLLIF